MNKVYIKKAIKMFLLICTMTMLFSIPASAAANISVKALKVGKTYNITDTSNVISTKPAVASATKKNSTKYTITALKKGRTTLKVYNSKGKITEKIYLIAYKSNSFKYDTDPITLNEGATKKVVATVQTGCTVKYKSSDKSIAKVNTNGKITAVSAGTATISAKVYYKNERIKTMKKTVTVTKKAETESSNKTTTQSSSNNSSSSANSTTSSSSSEKSTETETEVASTFKYHLESPSSYTVTGGKVVDICIDCEKESDIVTFQPSNNCVEIGEPNKCYIYDGYNQANAYSTSVNVFCRYAGTCEISVMLNGSLFKTVTVTVTSDDTDWIYYTNWKQQVIPKIWNNSMTDLEKIVALLEYIHANYEYAYNCSMYCFPTFPGGDCIAASNLIVDFVKEIGLEGETIPWKVNASADSNHHAAKIYIGNTYYVIDTWYGDGAIYDANTNFIYYNGHYV